jgi:hypothetical protein
MVSLLLSVVVAAAAPRPTVLALEPEGKGTTPVESAVVANAVAAGARELDAFQVMTAADIRTMMGLERQKQLLGTSTENLDFAEAMGARYVIAPTLTKLGTGLEVDLRLLDTSDNKVLAQKKSGRLDKPAEVTNAVSGLTQELLGVLLANEVGSVLVRSSEEGAEVRVDGKLLASTPMDKALAVPRGRHRLEVAKDGFITQFRPIVVSLNETTMEDVRLVPSPNYIDAYQQRNKRLRTGAWITTGAALVLAAGAILIDRLWAEPTYQNEFLLRQRGLRAGGAGGDQGDWRRSGSESGLDGARLETYLSCADEGSGNTMGTTCLDQATSIRNTIQVAQGLTIGLAAAAVLTAALSVYFWVAGEDPNKYSRLSFGFSPNRDGGSFALTGQW